MSRVTRWLEPLNDGLKRPIAVTQDRADAAPGDCQVYAAVPVEVKGHDGGGPDTERVRDPGGEDTVATSQQDEEAAAEILPPHAEVEVPVSVEVTRDDGL